MPVKTFARDFLRSILDRNPPPGVKLISNKLCGHRRWSLDYTLIFQEGDKFYRADYNIGATEQQDERPLEYEETSEASEVIPKEVITVQYVDAP